MISPPPAFPRVRADASALVKTRITPKSIDTTLDRARERPIMQRAIRLE